jgi:GTP-binding protein
VEAGLELARGDAVPFSAVLGTGSDALWARVAAAAEETAASPPV